MNPLHACRLLVMVSISLMVTLSYAADPQVGYQRGLTLGSQGKFAEAKAAFEQAIQADPQNTPSHNCLSVLTDVQAGRIKDQTAVHLFRAFIAYNLYRTDAAIQELNQAAALDPGYALIYTHRGDAYADRKQIDQALADYNQALKINPRHAQAYLHRGILYAKQSRLEQAMADFGRALKADPRYEPAYYSRGNIFAQQGRYDEAIADYNRLLEINPGYPHAYIRKALACEKAGRPQEALAAYQAYLQKVNLKAADPRQVQLVRDKIKSLAKQP
jgi:tetratricopeptide (TPR) repeat protein